MQIEHSLKLRLDRLSLCRYSDYADDVIGLLTITCTFEYLDLKQLIPKLDVQCIEIRMSIIFYVFYFFPILLYCDQCLNCEKRTGGQWRRLGRLERPRAIERGVSFKLFDGVGQC